MNPYHQFLAISGERETAPKQASSTSSVETGTPVEATQEQESAPQTVEPPITEVTETPAMEAAPQEPNTEYTEPTTTIGDTQKEVKEGTTINIFNPAGQTSTTTTAEDVSVDTLTGDIETGTEAGGGYGGGGFGGGGIFGGEEDGDVRASLPPKKSWMPLLVMAAGVAVIVLKPFEKKAS